MNDIKENKERFEGKFEDLKARLQKIESESKNRPLKFIKDFNGIDEKETLNFPDRFYSEQQNHNGIIIQKFYRKIYKNVHCLGCNKPIEILENKQYGFCNNCVDKQRFCDRLAVRYTMMKIISGKRIPECTICGERDVAVLQLNHLKDKKLYPYSANQLYSKILRGEIDAKDFDIRCSNCNLRYEYSKGKKFFDSFLAQRYLQKRKIIGRNDIITTKI